MNSKKWTIARPNKGVEHSYKDDGLVVLDYLEQQFRWWSIPVEIEFIKDKHDYNEAFAVGQENYSTMIKDQICYFKDDWSCITCLEYVFETEEDAWRYLARNQLKELKEKFEEIVNGQDIRVIQSIELLDKITHFSI